MKTIRLNFNAIFAFVFIIVAAMLPTISHAQIPPYGLYVMQGNSDSTGFWGRYWLQPTPTNSTIMMYDGTTQIPASAVIGTGLIWDGTSLSVGSLPQSSITGLVAALNGKFNVPAGTTSQYVRGDGTLAVLPTSPSRSFSYPTRTLNSCFLPSSTRDVDATYSVDISTSLSLTAGAVGTVYLRSYSNSSCTTGAQELGRIVNGQTGALTIGLALTQNVTSSLHAIVPAGSYVQLVTENTSGTPTFTQRAAAEVAL